MEHDERTGMKGKAGTSVLIPLVSCWAASEACRCSSLYSSVDATAEAVLVRVSVVPPRRASNSGSCLGAAEQGTFRQGFPP